jgi:arsenite methyltransferase
MAEQDIWSRWLLERRFGGNQQAHQDALENYLYPIRNRILDRAGLREGETLLDVGCGDGLVAFGALQRIPGTRIIFCDVSTDLLEVCRTIAAEMGALERCRFVQAPAEELQGVDDASVNAVTTRAVLIFTTQKQEALREFFRVLKPGGRISLFEPINHFGYPEPHGRFAGYDVTPVMDLAQPVMALFERPEINSMIDFDERDLLAYAEQAGFTELHLEYRADIQRLPGTGDWETFVRTAPNPRSPTIGEAIKQALLPEQARRFSAHLRQEVEANRSLQRMAEAHLWGVKGA